MDQLQWSISSDWEKRSPRHLPFECTAVHTSPHYGTAILHHHRPPESLLSQSQGSLLALMASVMVHAIQRQATLTNLYNEGQVPSVSPFGVVHKYIRPLLKTRLL